MEYILKASQLIRQSILKTLGGFCLIFLASYSFIWLILEPLQIDFHACIYLYRELLILSSSILTICIFTIMFSILKLQSFGLERSETNLLENAIVDFGNPIFNIANDNLSEKSLEIHGIFSDDVLKWDLGAIGQNATRLKYTYSVEPDLILYLRIMLIKTDVGNSQLVWISFRDDINKITPGTSEFEFAYPIKPKRKDNNWLVCQRNFKKISEEIFPDYKYKKIVSFQIRGNGKISKVVFK